MSLTRRKWIASLVAAAALLPLGGSAQIPPPSPPECVSGCENQGDPPARERRCRDVTVQYACGTEEKCDDLPGRGVVCVEVEKLCTTTETICE
jgi:hypothetical protein